LTFARSHGIIINELPPIGVWKRYRTQDHPRKRNGAAKYMGTHGFVQNHALSTVVSLWKPDSLDRLNSPDMRAIIIGQAKAEQERKKLQTEAVGKAVRMLNDSGLSTHEYLTAKGFPDEQGNVLLIEEQACPSHSNEVRQVARRSAADMAGRQQEIPVRPAHSRRDLLIR
jgi:putative DNA primase/helicase